MNFSNLGLSVELQRAVREQGYQTATPVQREAIPAILDGHDILAGAQTGTGKTAGFALPILQRLSDDNHRDRGRRVRVLVLAPTRELAVQLEESFRAYGRHLPFRTTAIYGGVNIDRQISTLRNGVDIVVATPGRLLDHLERRTIDLRNVQMLVLDEADRMLDMGFVRDIRRILKHLPPERQSMLFSATFSNEIRKLADSFLDRPREIQVAPRNAAADRVDQVAHHVERERKRELLSSLIGSEEWSQVLVFTRTKHGANRLSKQLVADGHRSTAIHGNKSQAARTRALDEFRTGRVRILVATDIAARGLDIEGLPCVVNFDLPNVPEDYVHRIGRTGRAGEGGLAVSLVSREERELMDRIERLLRRDIDRVAVTGFEPNGRTGQAPGRSGGGSAPRARGGHPASGAHRPDGRGRSARSGRKGYVHVSR